MRRRETGLLATNEAMWKWSAGIMPMEKIERGRDENSRNIAVLCVRVVDFLLFFHAQQCGTAS
jgi:hypothetical protein